ncbi:hypothetical protein V6N11_077144 [Hibiscus sabdariffa]|uniref:Uncharacterized protein n=1 Tax=Hibiscus sabdariffa TaxID=183260 RepID=A0ABR2TD17_9ROSI
MQNPSPLDGDLKDSTADEALVTDLGQKGGWRVGGLDYSNAIDFDADRHQGFDGVGMSASSPSKLNGIASMEAKAKAIYASMVREVVSTETTLESRTNKIDKPEGLFGPWMVAGNRYRRAKPSVQGNRDKQQGHDATVGSCFAVLDLDGEDKLDSMLVEVEDDATTRVVGNIDSFLQQRVSSPTPVVLNDVYLASNPPRKLKATEGVLRADEEATSGHWLKGVGILANYVDHATQNNLSWVTLVAMLDGQGSWNWPTFQHLLPVPILFPRVNWGLIIAHNHWLADTSHAAIVAKPTHTTRLMWQQQPVGFCQVLAETDNAEALKLIQHDDNQE